MSLGHILCLTSNFPRWPGDATTPFVLHLAQDLQHIGWQITVLAPHAPGCQRQEILGGIPVRRFRYLLPEGLQTVCYQGGALINLRQNPFNFAKLLPLVCCEWLQTRLFLGSGRFDLLHSHWLLPQGFVGAMAAGLLGVPHVSTVHGGDVFALRGRILTKFKAFTLRHADAVTVNSSVTEQAVRAIQPATRRLCRIPMGVSIPSAPPAADAVQAIRQRYRQGDGPLLIFIGRLIEEKGVDDLLRAMAIALPRLPMLSALIVGEGQDRGQFEDTALALGLKGRVSFSGWVEAAAIPTYLAAADIFVGPSRQSREGWVEAQGLTFIEAMVAETPVVASRSGGIVDSVRHEETGLLVKERDAEGIAQAIVRLVEEPGLAAHLRQTAYAWVKEKFSRSASALQFSRLFTSVLNDRPAARRAGGGGA